MTGDRFGDKFIKNDEEDHDSAYIKAEHNKTLSNLKNWDLILPDHLSKWKYKSLRNKNTVIYLKIVL